MLCSSVLLSIYPASAAAWKKFVCTGNGPIAEIFALEDGTPARSSSSDSVEPFLSYGLVDSSDILATLEVDKTGDYFEGSSPDLSHLETATLFFKPAQGADGKAFVQLKIWDLNFDGAKQLQVSECHKSK